MKYMAKFSATYPDAEFVQRALHKLPWRHNIVIMEKVKDSAQREWYIARAYDRFVEISADRLASYRLSASGMRNVVREYNH